MPKIIIEDYLQVINNGKSAKVGIYISEIGEYDEQKETYTIHKSLLTEDGYLVGEGYIEEDIYDDVELSEFIEITDILDDCSQDELQDVRDWLIDSSNWNSNIDWEFDQMASDLFEARFKMSLEDEEKIKEILKKY